LKKDIEYFGDPFQTYGFGLVAYRSTIKKLGWVFALFSIIALPIILTYNSGDALSGGHASKYGWSTIGNLGYNTVQCKNSIMAMGIYQLQCPYGTMEDLKDFGVNPKGKKAINGEKAEPDYSKNQACI